MRFRNINPYEEPDYNSLSDFTDDELIDIIKDAIKKCKNPKHLTYMGFPQ